MLETVLSVSNQLGIKILFRSNQEHLWENALMNCPYIPYDYTNESIEYQLSYQAGQGGEWIDISLLFIWESKIVGLWPLTVSKKNLYFDITSQGQPVNPPLFSSDLNSKIKRKLVKQSVEMLYLLCKAFDIKKLTSVERFSNQYSVSEWQIATMSKGANCDLQHDLYLNTFDPIELINKNFGARLRNDIKRGLSFWNSELLTAESPNIDKIWADFKNLHLMASGRVTKSDASWDLQKLTIKNNTAFLSYITDINKKIIGGGYFTLSRDEAVYAVGAYDRSLFDKPLGHVVQFEGIKEIVRRKKRWYKIGFYSYASDRPKPTEKEISIGRFKKQFSSHLFYRVIINHIL